MNKTGVKYPSIVTFYFVTRAKSKDLINLKRVLQKKYNQYIRGYCSSNLKMMVLDIDKNGN